MHSALKRQQSDVHQLSCQITDQLFAGLFELAPLNDKSGGFATADEALDGLISPRNIYFRVFSTFTPVMAPPSLPASERREVLKTTVNQWDETVKALCKSRSTQLKNGLLRAKTRHERLDSVRY